MVLRLSLHSSQSLWWYSDYPFTHQSDSSCWSSVYPYPHYILLGGTQTNTIRIIVFLVVLRIYPYSPQSTWWLRQSLYPSQSPSWFPDFPFTHNLPGGTRTIPIFISSQSPLWYSDYPFTHHSLSGGTQTIPMLTKVILLVGHQSIPIHITFCLVVLRLTLYAS